MHMSLKIVLVVLAAVIAGVFVGGIYDINQGSTAPTGIKII